MIDINQLLEWKQSYEDIYQIEILGQHFIFRPLGREEYKAIVLMDMDLGDFQEAICFSTVIYPKEFDFTRGVAGVAEILSDSILDVSGLHLGQAKTLLDGFREEMFNYDYQVDVLIHEAFPEFTLEEIATWTIRKTMFYLSRAEWIITNLKGVQLQTIDQAVIEQYEQEQQMQQQQSQQPFIPTEEMPPEFREQIQHTELAGSEEFAGDTFGFGNTPKQPSKPAPEGGIQSEEELLAMLAGTGKTVAAPSTSMNHNPELKWFEYMDELKGEFD